uniref:SKA complex subunit 1 n=1 Tax=Callorhinchus milii TaxID=7868 RepID=A0A4W3IY47_CALMI
MTSTDLQDLSVHMNNKISLIKRSLQLKKMGYDPSQTKVLQKIEQELSDIWYLLDTFQAEILRQKTDLKVIKDLRNSVDETHKTAQHLVENVPSHLPKKAAPTSSATQKTEAVQPDPDKPEHTKNSTKPKQFVRGMEFLVIEEFNQIPTYMKGRMTYDQINAVIKELNDIVKAKYKILNQPLKSMNNTTRNQYHSFKEQEVKETKGRGQEILRINETLKNWSLTSLPFVGHYCAQLGDSKKASEGEKMCTIGCQRSPKKSTAATLYRIFYEAL